MIKPDRVVADDPKWLMPEFASAMKNESLNACPTIDVTGVGDDIARPVSTSDCTKPENGKP